MIRRLLPAALAAFALTVAAQADELRKPADDPSIRLINRGPEPIVEFFATPAGRTNWGQNRLTAGPLAPATGRLIRIARTGDCVFDLRVVFANHTAKEKRGANLCRITELPVP